MDHMYDTGINAAMGGIQKFANSDWLKRKMPMAVGPMNDAASALRSRLSGGMDDFANPKGIGGETRMDGIER